MIQPAVRCPNCKGFAIKDGTCLKCGYTGIGESMSAKKEEAKEQTKAPVNTNNESATSIPAQSANTAISGINLSKLSLYELEGLFERLNIPLPEVDYSEEDLIDILQEYYEQDDEDNDEDYEENDDDENYEDDNEDYESDDEAYEETDTETDEESVEVEEMDDLNERDYTELDVSQLRSLCDERNLSYSAHDKKAALITLLVNDDENEETDEENEELDYSEMSLTDLQALCEERDIAYVKKDKKSKLIMLLCNYDEKQEETEAEEVDYADFNISALQELCDKRGISYTAKDKKAKLIALLYADDENGDDEEYEEEADEEIDYTSLSLPQLKKLCDDKGIFYQKDAKKAVLIALLVQYDENDEDEDYDEDYEEEYDEDDEEDEDGEEYEDDEEYEDNEEDDEYEDEEIDYSELRVVDLKEICDDRDIAYRSKATKSELIALLEEDDRLLEDEKEPAKENSQSNISKLLGIGMKKNTAAKKEEEPDDEVESLYEPNHDHYYDDVLPEVIADMERIPKEAIIKGIGCVALVFSAIVFFIYYF